MEVGGFFDLFTYVPNIRIRFQGKKHVKEYLVPSNKISVRDRREVVKLFVKIVMITLCIGSSIGQGEKDLVNSE